jgi:hypothetical protein
MEGDDKIVEKKSLKGEKNVGMIEWSFKMWKKEYKCGSEIIVIENEIK